MKKSLTIAFALAGLALVLAATSILSACSTVAQAQNIVNPRYSLQNFRPRLNIAIPPQASTIDFDFDLGVDNPNSVGLRLDRVDFDLLVNNEHLLNSTSTQQVRIPARGFGAVHLTSRVGATAPRSATSCGGRSWWTPPRGNTGRGALGRRRRGFAATFVPYFRRWRRWRTEAE